MQTMLYNSIVFAVLVDSWSNVLLFHCFIASWLRYLNDYGFCLLKDVPTRMEEIKNVRFKFDKLNFLLVYLWCHAAGVLYTDHIAGS